MKAGTPSRSAVSMVLIETLASTSQECLQTKTVSSKLINHFCNADVNASVKVEQIQRCETFIAHG